LGSIASGFDRGEEQHPQPIGPRSMPQEAPDPGLDLEFEPFEQAEAASAAQRSPRIAARAIQEHWRG
jgi:hypothetical protein